MKIKTNILLRIYFVYALILMSAVAVLGKIYYIQTYKGDYWIKKSEIFSMKMFTIPGERGNIYTYDENLLATSIPFFDIYVDFGSDGMTREVFDANVDSLSIYMANNFKKKSASQYKQTLVQAKKNKKRYFLIKRNVDYSTLKEIKQWPLFREGKYKGGLIVDMKQSRKYPYSLLALRTIGENRKNSQSIGLEASYDKYLSGTEGQILKQKISGNLWVPIHNESTIEPKNGDDIVTTIDINLQDATESALKKALDSSNAEFGCAVVMEVETGAIRAIANLGRMDNGQLWEIENYAVSHKSEPGSTFKAASYLMLLDNNYININDTVSNGGGRWNFYGRTMSDEHIYESSLSVKDAFARSSNIAIARLIDKNYKNKKNVFYETMQKYGLTEMSGIDLKGETKPNVTLPAKWSNLSLPWRATGYEQTFSPIQILTFYNTIANNGYRAQPYLVERVTRNGKTIQQFLPQIGKKPIAKQKAIDDIKELLKGVIENARGTGRSIKSEYFELAGKSGTAKLLGNNKSYGSANQAMFAGFFPVIKPRYSCVVLIYNPKGAQRTGGGISAPVFKEIAEKALSIDLHLSPDYKKTIETPPSTLADLKGETHQIKNVISRYGYTMDVNDEIQYIDVKIKKSGIKLQPTATSENIVPNLLGLNFDDALYLLENMGLKIRYNGLGKIVQQSIPAGTKISRGSHISITMR